MKRAGLLASRRRVRRWSSASSPFLAAGALLVSPLPAALGQGVEGPTWTVESDQADAQLGESVATAGDVNGDGFSDVIVGAWRFDGSQTGEGRALVYHGSAGGLATAAAWTSDGGQGGARHGTSVSTAGDVNGDGFDDVIVGAPFWDGLDVNEGRALLYLGSAGGLATDAAWSFEGGQAAATLGDAVARAGDVNGDGYADVLVAASRHDGSLLDVDSGRVYLFLGSPGGLSTAPDAVLEDGSAGSRFGYSIGTAGDVDADGYADVVVGAHLEDSSSGETGRAFLYLGSSAGLPTSPAWTADGDQHGCRFGSSVGTAGDVDGDGYADVLVGARRHDDGEADEGAVFLFRGSAVGPEGTPAWSAHGDQLDARLGFSVATAGDLDGDGYADVIVGAPYHDDALVDEGAAYVYLGSSSGLSTAPAHVSYGGQALAEHGHAVATAGDVDGDGYSEVLVGAPLFDGGELDEGRASLFRGSPELPSALPDPLAYGPALVPNGYGHFGSPVAAAGDVNGDGYQDLLVGSPGFAPSDPLVIMGAAYLFLGSASGLETDPAWTVVGTVQDAHFGDTVAGAGDVNGDGFDDLLVGAWEHWEFAIPPPPVAGAVFVYLGSASGPGTVHDQLLVGVLDGEHFGRSVAPAGDVNGDGYADVVVGSPERFTSWGRASVFLGSPRGLSATPAWTVDGGPSDYLGYSAATAGDVNGDGFDDLIVGAPGADDNNLHEGRAYVYLGSPVGLGTTPHWNADLDQVYANLGYRVGTAGDVNGDGHADVFATSVWYDDGEEDEGAIFVWHGSASGLGPEGTPLNADAVLEVDVVQAHFGTAVAAAGDVDADGHGDLVAGWYSFSGPESYEGAALLYLGSPGGLATSASWSVEGDHDSALLGDAVDGAADFDGDGFVDLVAGSPGLGPVFNDGRGSLQVFPGNATRGQLRGPWQERLIGDGLVGLGCTTVPFVGVRLTAVGRSAAGRALVALETEVAPLGVALDGSGAQLGPPTDTGAPGPDGSAVRQEASVAGLAYATPYRWRLRWISRDPFFPRSPWFSLAGNTVTETKLRTPVVGTRTPTTHAGKRGAGRVIVR